MTAPAKLKLTIYQGATFRKRLTWKGPLPAQTPIDLTGCTARMQVRPEVESSTVLLELTTANGGMVPVKLLATQNATVKLGLKVKTRIF